jgi:RNA polymerase sigma-70 factor (ECF subfamily)
VEKEVIKKAIKGDPDALAELISKYQDWIHRWAFKIVKNTADAADVAQEVSLKILTSLSSLQEESKLEHWIYRITYHISLNWLRLTKKTIPLNDTEINHTSNSDNFLILEKKEDVVRLNEALEELPAPYRLIITLYYFDEYSYQKIAGVLKIPIGTVKTQLYRAKEMLKEKLSRTV